MIKHLDDIYNKLYTDIYGILDSANYASNADGYNQIANNNNEAFHQIIEGSIKQNDAYHLYDLIDNIPINTYLEIGSYVGVSFRIINEIFCPTVSYSVDPNIAHRVFFQPRDIFSKLNSRFSDKIHIINSYWIESDNDADNTINADYFRNLDITFDLIFIDAIHTYERVKADFYEAIKILSKEGIILLHDIYSWTEVNKFIDELKKDTQFNVRLSPKTEGTIDGFATVKVNHAKNN